MDDLKINWDHERPSERQAILLWNDIKIEPIETWSDSALFFKTKINETHTNGGLQFHKYKIFGSRHFTWFSERNRLNEIDFLNNILKRPELIGYLRDLQIESTVAEIKTPKYLTDIYDLPGELARRLSQGGAYNNLDSQNAWKIANEFVEGEFQNRFDEFISYYFAIDNANWFFEVAWDYSVLLFDKRNNEVIFIDITDTD